MNRRTFISTITALALAAKATLITPVANVIRRRRGQYLYATAGEQLRAGDAVHIRDGKVYKHPTGNAK